jgi:uncharacterized lipoprotein YddW (UPF0748 family)
MHHAPILLLLASLLHPLSAQARVPAPPEPTREFRAMWIATVHNIDWPSRPGLSVDAQKQELRTLLDRAASLRLNAVIFQVRPHADALYQSSIEPWSPWLTGTMGRSPGYDPLAFATAEAHARGLELHAWINPFRALATQRFAASNDHVAKAKPAWTVRHGDQTWLDPAIPEVRQRALEVVADILRRYDVDGIHIDDYFYPYPSGGIPSGQFADNATFAAYQSRGGKLDRADWRRSNVDGFVKDFYATARRHSGAAKVGISPFGIWRPGVPEGTQAGLDAYSHLYADSRRWLQEGWLDYFSPQLYWTDAGPQSFSKLIAWWQSQNTSARHVWPGIATDRVGQGRAASEIAHQVDLSRNAARQGSAGHIHWNASAITGNRGGAGQLLQAQRYQDRALVPASPWLRASSQPPAAQGNAARQGDQLHFSWTPRGKADGLRWWVIQTYDGQSWRLAGLYRGHVNRSHLPSADAQAVAIRSMGPSGLLGQPLVLTP